MHFGRRIFAIDIPVDEFALNLIDAFEELGIQVTRSFDLQSACAPHNSPCPHHGTIPCNCQLIVLIICCWDEMQGTLTIHGNEGHSEISMIQEGDVWSEVIEESVIQAIKTAMRNEVH